MFPVLVLVNRPGTKLLVYPYLELPLEPTNLPTRVESRNELRETSQLHSVSRGI